MQTVGAMTDRAELSQASSPGWGVWAVLVLAYGRANRTCAVVESETKRERERERERQRERETEREREREGRDKPSSETIFAHSLVVQSCVVSLVVVVRDWRGRKSARTYHEEREREREKSKKERKKESVTRHDVQALLGLALSSLHGNITGLNRKATMPKAGYFPAAARPGMRRVVSGSSSLHGIQVQRIRVACPATCTAQDVCKH